MGIIFSQRLHYLSTCHSSDTVKPVTGKQEYPSGLAQIKQCTFGCEALAHYQEPQKALRRVSIRKLLSKGTKVSSLLGYGPKRVFKTTQLSQLNWDWRCRAQAKGCVELSWVNHVVLSTV